MCAYKHVHLKTKQPCSVSGLPSTLGPARWQLANKLDAAVSGAGRAPLPVLVQVNTSGEESKYGVAPGEAAVSLARHVATECGCLRLAGLMTIGQPDYSSRPENFTVKHGAVLTALSMACGAARFLCSQRTMVHAREAIGWVLIACSWMPSVCVVALVRVTRAAVSQQDRHTGRVALRYKAVHVLNRCVVHRAVLAEVSRRGGSGAGAR